MGDRKESEHWSEKARVKGVVWNEICSSVARALLWKENSFRRDAEKDIAPTYSYCSKLKRVGSQLLPILCNVDDGLVGKLRVNVRKFKLLLSLIERRTSVVFVFVCKSSSEYYTDSLRMMIRMQKEFVIY